MVSVGYSHSVSEVNLLGYIYICFIVSLIRSQQLDIDKWVRNRVEDCRGDLPPWMRSDDVSRDGGFE